MSAPTRSRAAIVALLAALAATACSDLLAPPAGAPASVAVSFALSPDAPPAGQSNPGRAFDRVDQVHVRLFRGQEPVFADSFAASPADSGVIRRTLRLQLRQAREEMTLALELRGQGRLLFTGSQLVTLSRGAQVATEVPLQPVAAAVVIGPAPAFGSLGDTARAAAAVTFATGDTVPGATITWSGLDPAVLQVLADGRMIARGEGQGRAVATFGALTAQTTVAVRARVASVTLAPDSAVILRADSVRFHATARDARGNVLARTFTWATSAPQVAVVGTGGMARGEAVGQAQVRATADSVTGTGRVVVLPRRGHLAVSVVNAANGRPVPGATVWALRSNAPPNSPPSATAVSDTAGMARMAGLVEDTYVVVASAPGMITAPTPNVVLAPDQATLLRSVLSPVLRPGQTRIVVTWDGAPTDLDAHLTGPDPYGGTFHVFDRAPTSLAEDSTVAVRLDRNDTSGHGPETVTIYQQLQGTYCFSVHHYAGAGTLATSAALVRVFRESQQVTAFNVPNTTSRVWTVFRMNGDAITPVNTTGSTVPGVCP